MATITIEVPRGVEEFLSRRAAAQGYAKTGDYVADLLLLHQQRESLERKLLDAVESGDFEEVTPQFWSGMRQHVSLELR